MNTQPRDSIFISYSHEDEKWLELFTLMLRPLAERYSIRIWSDKHLQPGAAWKGEIETELKRAKIAILLASPHFLASDFIKTHELPRLLDAASRDECAILWIPVSACLYTETELQNYQAAFSPRRPLDSLTRARRWQVLVDLAMQIKIRISCEEAIQARGAELQAA